MIPSTVQFFERPKTIVTLEGNTIPSSDNKAKNVVSPVLLTVGQILQKHICRYRRNGDKNGYDFNRKRVRNGGRVVFCERAQF